MTVKIVDISNWQTGFNFQQFRNGGGLAVVLKATEGLSVQDKSYKTFRQQAIASGLGIMTYHFFRSSDPTRQAEYYLNFACPEIGERVVCDYEDSSCTIAGMEKFFEHIQTLRPDLQLTVYSGHLVKDQLGKKGNTYLADNTSLWLAQYTTGQPSWLTQIWPYWSLWQYSDKGRVPGFNGDIDCNRFNGSDDQLLAWVGPVTEPAPSPEPEPQPPLPGIPEISIHIASDTPVTLRVEVNENVTIMSN